MNYVPTASCVKICETVRDGLLNGLADLRLYQNNVAFVPGLLAAAFTEANFGGYTPALAIPFGPATPLAELNGFTKGQTTTFASDGTAPANDVYGFYLTDAAGDLVYCASFDTGPKHMAVVGDEIEIAHGLSISMAALTS